MSGGGRRAGKIIEQVIEWNPDIVALAEFRGTAPSRSIAKRLDDAGYIHQFLTVLDDEPKWNALFLASRNELTRVQIEGAPEPELYWLLAKVEADHSFHVGVFHAPYWSRGRAPFYEAMLKGARDWQLGPGLFIGDTNSAITGLDEETYSSEQYDETLIEPLKKAGWIDPFRVFHPDVCAPTWYSPHGNGYRIDQAFVNAELQPRVTSCEYDWGNSKTFGKLSDHAALLLNLKLS